ncbi:MAG: FAD-dependent oxidoreductase, partial [Pseudomonadota bacterium]
MEQTGGEVSRPCLTRRSVIVTSLGASLAGCIGPQASGTPGVPKPIGAYGFGALKPLDLDPANLTKITVCLRPFRPAGPRLQATRAGEKLLIHNYGHGGSGWSLAWGYAEAVRDMMMAERPQTVSVVGAGVMGLTSAIAIAETGARVSIFAREMPMESASAKATGVWSPSSRIGMTGAVGSDFATRWEALARRSYARHLLYVGRAGHPVEFTPRFYIRSDAPATPLAGVPDGSSRFLGLGRNLRGLAPPWGTRPWHPFPTERGVRGGLVMTFNVAEYTRQLTEDFLALGGRIERVELASLEALAGLPGDAVVNCTGFGARGL